MKKYLKIALILFLSLTVFFGSSYLYLYKSLKSRQKPTDEKQEGVPYFETPENCGLLFYLPNENKVLFFLDFEQEMSYIINIYENDDIMGNYVGYPVDYRFEIDYHILSLLFDRLGGLDLGADGEARRFTGIQVCDIMCKNPPNEVLYEIVFQVCDRISQNGYNIDDFTFLIENSKTNLTVPVCFYWQDRIKKLFSNSVFVNWEI